MANKILKSDPEFPPLLKEIQDPPGALFMKGKIPDYNRPLVAIIGTRVPSSYGVEMAVSFASTLAEAGCVIVSGFARGIDTIAHKSALELHGETIAVLGCGLGHIYPPENKELFQKIAEHGAFLTEFPDDMEPKPWNFPSRNRIIAGMSDVTLVIEAPRKSGALITADFANQYGRQVFAVPGNIGQKGSFGTNELIKQGAYIATSPEDILEYLHFEPTLQEKMSQMQCTEEEAAILILLGNGPKSIDEIIQETSIPVGKIGSLLTVLELKRLVCNDLCVYRLRNGGNGNS